MDWADEDFLGILRAAQGGAVRRGHTRIPWRWETRLHHDDSRVRGCRWKGVARLSTSWKPGARDFALYCTRALGCRYGTAG